MRTRRLASKVTHFATAATLAVAALAVTPATAVTITGSVASSDPSAPYTLSDLNSYGSTTSGTYETPSTFTIGDATINFAPGAYLADGSASGITAAPVMSNSLTDPNVYLAAEPGANITITYSALQNSFILLWGSVDTYNTLNFYNGTNLVASITGGALAQAIAGLTSGGSQAGDGSAWISLAFASNEWFNSVQAVTSSPAFEFNFVNVPAAAVPEPGTFAVLGAALAGMAGFASARRRK